MKKKEIRLWICVWAFLVGTLFSWSCVRADQTYTVTFYGRQGKLIAPSRLAGHSNPAQVSAGRKFILDSLTGSSKDTFLGWSLTPGKTTNPKYGAYYGKPIRSDMDFYAVYYPLSEEQNLTSITPLKKSKYVKAIFVGDSRMTRTEKALKSRKGLAPENVEFIAASGYNLNMYRLDLESDVIASVKKSNQKKGKPIAVVFALGINDLKNLKNQAIAKTRARTYITYLKKLASKLKKYNVKLFFMSLNPVNSSQTIAYRKKYDAVTSIRYECDIRAFNNEMKENLPSPWQFIDSYTWLEKNGFSMVDGVHFTPKSSKRILNYVIRYLNKAS